MQLEAGKITLGQHFASFRDFDRCMDSYGGDRCMDSYGVIHGQAAAKYATKHGHAIRVCRFGMTTRTASTRPSTHKKMEPMISQQLPLCSDSEPLFTPCSLQEKVPTSTIDTSLEINGGFDFEPLFTPRHYNRNCQLVPHILL